MKLIVTENHSEIILNGRQDCIRLAAILGEGKLGKAFPLILYSAFVTWCSRQTKEDVEQVINEREFIEEVFNIEIKGKEMTTLDLLLYKAEEAITGAERLDA